LAVYQDTGQVYVQHVSALGAATGAESAKRDAPASILVLTVFEGEHIDLHHGNELMEAWC